MRVVVAIIAAIMSVTTGGPLRCPCLLANTISTTKSEPSPAPAQIPQDDCCPCKAHRKPATPQPADHKPAPRVPCNHLPSFDCAAGTFGVERPTPERDAGDTPTGADPDICPIAVSHVTGTRLQTEHFHPPAARLLLRFCHSFRC